MQRVKIEREIKSESGAANKATKKEFDFLRENGSFDSSCVMGSTGGILIVDVTYSAYSEYWHTYYVYSLHLPLLCGSYTRHIIFFQTILPVRNIIFCPIFYLRI